MSSLHLLWCLVSLLVIPCCALLEESFIAFSAGNGSLALSQASILIDDNDSAGVHIAANSLASDFDAVLGRALNVVKYGSDNASTNGISKAIIVGSITDSLVIKDLVDAEIIDVSEIEGKWEMFMTSVVQNPLPNIDEALVIVGSDKRGTIYGIYTLSEQAGQSP
jgi:hypothetical protein